METTSVRLRTLPGMLRKGDLVEDTLPNGAVRTYTLTKHPEYDVITYRDHLMPVVYLVGRDDYAGKPVIIAKCARLTLGSSRELPLNGRRPPVFLAPPEPTALY